MIEFLLIAALIVSFEAILPGAIRALGIGAFPAGELEIKEFHKRLGFLKGGRAVPAASALVFAPLISFEQTAAFSAFGLMASIVIWMGWLVRAVYAARLKS